MKGKKDIKEKSKVMEEFEVRQNRQILAIAVVMFLVLLCAVLYKRPTLLGVFSKSELFGAQIAIIALFMGFTAYNWRCPSCGKFLGSDIHRNTCRKCNTRLK